MSSRFDPSHEENLAEQAWNCRVRDRERSIRLAQIVRDTADGDAQQMLSSYIVTAYNAMREGQMAEALTLVEPAIAWLEQIGESRWLARALNVQNCVTAELGEFERCISGLGQQLEISQANDDLEMQGCAFHDLGVLHLERDPTRAAQHLTVALELFERMKLVEGQGYALLNLTQLSLNAHRHDDAQTLVERTLQLARDHRLKHIETHALMQQGALELGAGRLERAETLLGQAMTRTASSGDRPLLEIMPLIVELQRRKAQLNLARDQLYAQLSFATQRKLMPFEIQAHELLTDVLEELGDIAGALRHSRASMTLTKKLHRTTKEDKIRALEVLHRTQYAQRKAADETRKNAHLTAALHSLETENRSVRLTSETDELTGLHNRRFVLNTDLKRWAAQGLSVALIDLDHFKSINDRFGHESGDFVLKEVAALLKTQVRDQDIVARFGGEEFLILFPKTAIHAAHTVLTRILFKLHNHIWPALPNLEPLSFTAGITRCDDQDLQSAIKRADALLYQGKNSGRNGIWVAETALARAD